MAIKYYTQIKEYTFKIRRLGTSSHIAPNHGKPQNPKGLILATEMDFFVRICGVNRIKHIQNEKIRKRLEIEESAIEKKQ